jgi:hypothetical protein
VALLVPEYQHHNLATEWFRREATRHGWATCAVTRRHSREPDAPQTAPESLFAPTLVSGGLPSGGYCWNSGVMSLQGCF